MSNARLKQAAPTRTSVKYESGLVVSTFEAPPPDFDPVTADPVTLRDYGYPPRPRDPSALARWRELLGKPLRSIKPVITRMSKKRRFPAFEKPESADIWSGAAVFGGPPTPFFTVSARWTVPKKFKSFKDGDDRSVSFWIGIDGHEAKPKDLLQAGVRADMSSGDDEPDLYAWFEWLPDSENSLDLPVALGDAITCVITADENCLPRYSQHGTFESIDDDHQLVTMHDGKVLDWRSDGTWRLYGYDPKSKDGLRGHRVAGSQWKTIDDNHVLVPMHDGKILDWVPENGSWRLWRYEPDNKENCLAGPISHGQWKSVRDGQVLLPMKDGKVLDWAPDDGSWRLWNYDPENHQDCLPGPMVSNGQWATIDDDHTLVPMHDGRILDWTSDGGWRLWDYDPKDRHNCLVVPAVACGQWLTIDDDHTLVPMHDGHVLDWTGNGDWRLFDYDRNGHSAVFASIVLRNETQHVQACLHLQAPDGTLLRGDTVEWIVERPSEGTSLEDLTALPLLGYGSVEFTHAHAEKEGGGLVKAADGTDIDMVEGGKTISKGVASGETVTCTST